MLRRCVIYEEDERLLSLGCISKNSDVFLRKGMGEDSNEIQTKNIDCIEGGSCSFIADEENHYVVLDMVPYKGDEVMEIESLDVNPVAVIEGQELPETVSCDWVVARVKNFCHVVGSLHEGFEEQMLALFIAIEANRKNSSMASTSDVSAKTDTKWKKEN